MMMIEVRARKDYGREEVEKEQMMLKVTIFMERMASLQIEAPKNSRSSLCHALYSAKRKQTGGRNRTGKGILGGHTVGVYDMVKILSLRHCQALRIVLGQGKVQKLIHGVISPCKGRP